MIELQNQIIPDFKGDRQDKSVSVTEDGFALLLQDQNTKLTGRPIAPQVEVHSTIREETVSIAEATNSSVESTMLTNDFLSQTAINVNKQVPALDPKLGDGDQLPSLPIGFIELPINRPIPDDQISKHTALVDAFESSTEFPSAKSSEKQNIGITQIEILHNVDAFDQNKNDKNIRLIPFSAIATGIMSYGGVPTQNHQQMGSLDLRLTLSSNVLKHSVLSTIDPLFFTQNTSANETQQPTHAFTQKGDMKINVNQLNIDKSFQFSSAIATPISKTHLLVTNSQATTLWLRDFSLSESEKNQLKERVVFSDFRKSLNINRIMLNGNLLWNEKEGALHD